MLLLNLALFVRNESARWSSSQWPSLRFVGDIPEPSVFHPYSTAATALRPLIELCQSLELTTLL